MMTGFAQSQERVAELLRNLTGSSQWLERPDLTEVRAVALDQDKTGRKVVEFTLAVGIKRPRDKDADARSGRAASAGAAASRRRQQRRRRRRPA